MIMEKILAFIFVFPYIILISIILGRVRKKHNRKGGDKKL